MKYENLERCLGAIAILENMGMQDTEAYSDAITQRNAFIAAADAEEVDRKINDEEYIYSTLKSHSKFPYTAEKKKCIRDTVEHLLENGENATEPVLLLGKIQCGKTDTFENIMGLAFDKGIEVAVVLTKGTNALAKQTQERMQVDYKWFKDNGQTDQKAIVRIYDIIEDFRRNGLMESVMARNNTKVVIICKKNAKNLEHLIDLFENKSPWLKSKKVLVVDDEADFASRNYVSRLNSDNKRYIALARISEQIDAFVKIPEYCRYLQVTATPYSLYLQPDGFVELDDNGTVAPTFKPRYTTLVPVYAAYVGGDQYFVQSRNPDSMFSHLYHPVAPKCVQVIGHRDKRYEKHGIYSRNICDLTYALVSYVMATAVRYIQEHKEGRYYKSSALIHADIAKTEHEWQCDLIAGMLRQIGEGFNGIENNAHIAGYFDNIYNDFKASNEKGKKEYNDIPDLPTKKDLLACIKRLFNDKEIAIRVVNSDNDVKAMLNDDGQLNLISTANIFIGGSILDRGITIGNMLCFFYGRDPKKFQMDTVLQHARMYGARPMSDMAVTRFHTTEAIYSVFAKMNDLDEQLRDWFVNHHNGDTKAVFVGFDQRIKPCAPQKIKISNTLTIKPQIRLLPVGFQTKCKTTISNTIKWIDDTIMSLPNYDRDGFFTIKRDLAYEILGKISSTYDYGQPDNVGMSWNPLEFIGVIEYSLETCGEDEIYVLHRTNRNMSRVRANGCFIDAPDDGRTDLAPSRKKAQNRPVLMLIRENGVKDDGWRDTPFYWPVLVAPENISPTIFTIDGKLLTKEVEILSASDLIAGYHSEDILYLTISEQNFWSILFGYKKEEYRTIHDTMANKLLVHDYDNPKLKYKIREDITIDMSLISGINSRHNDIFPFEPRQFKYMLLRSSRDFSGSLLLVELEDESHKYKFTSSSITDRDVIISKDNRETTFEGDNSCTWTVTIRIKRVIKYKLNQAHTASFDDIRDYYNQLNQEVNEE